MASTQAQTSTTTGERRVFRVGTRKSLLARAQADAVVKALQTAWPDLTFEIVAMATTGDNNQTTALHKFNEKALWTQELEELLIREELDLIVHSLKDMPTQLPHGLILGSVTLRVDPRDVLVIKPSLAETYRGLADLPEGSVIGTSSLRRIAQLRRHYTHLKFADVRGNIGTRLAKLDDPDSQYSALILAAAGLERIGLGHRITTRLSKSNGNMLHAVGQGGLGVESRADDTKVAELLSKIGEDRAFKAALAERSLMRTLEGGCSVPIGVETEWVSKKGLSQPEAGVGIKPADDYDQLSGKAASSSGNVSGDATDDGLTDELIMRAIVVSLDGQEAVETEGRKRVTSHEHAEEFGMELARQLISQGADKILERIELNRKIIKEQGQA